MKRKPKFRAALVATAWTGGVIGFISGEIYTLNFLTKHFGMDATLKLLGVLFVAFVWFAIYCISLAFSGRRGPERKS